MADFPARIKPKKSSVAGEVPSALDLEVAEIAVNTADGKLFVKHTDETIKEISGTGGGSGGGGASKTIDLLDVSPAQAEPGEVLVYQDAELAPPEVSLRLIFNSALGPVDSSSYEASMTTYGTATFPSPGLNGAADRCMRIATGPNRGYVQAADGPQFDLGTDDFTIEGWVYIEDPFPLDGTGTGDIVAIAGQRIDYSNSHSWGLALLFNDENKPAIVLTQNGTTNYYSNSLDVSPQLNVQEWVHVCVLKTSGVVTFALNGQFAGSSPLASNSFNNSTSPLVVGAVNSGGTTPEAQYAFRLDMMRVSKTIFYPTDGTSFTPSQTFSGLPAQYAPRLLSMKDLENVKSTATNNQEELLTFEGVSSLQLDTTNKPSDENYALYANSTYGFTLGRYVPGTQTEATRNRARRTYYSDQGIVHNLGSEPLWLVGRLGDASTDNLPELRWTRGNPISAPTGSYFGMVQSNLQSTSATYTLPAELPTVNQYLACTSSGNTYWTDPVELVNSYPFTLSTLLLLNNEQNGRDVPLTIDASGMTTPYPSQDAKFGNGGASFLRANADHLDANMSESLGSKPFTFEFWYRSEDTTYIKGVFTRIFSPGVETNVATGFQIFKRTANSAATNNGYIELNPTGNDLLCSTEQTLDDGSWHWVVFQHNGVGRYRSWVDGSLTKDTQRAEGAVNFNTTNLYIGTRGDKNAESYFTGSLDGIALYPNGEKYDEALISVPTEPPVADYVVSGGIVLTSIDDLADVNTSTNPPTQGQALVWDEFSANWVPGNVASGGGSDAPSFLSSTIASDSAEKTSLTLANPGNLAEGDTLVAAIMNRVSGAVTPPAGWTVLNTYEHGDTTNQGVTIFTKSATSSEPADYTFTQATTNRLAGLIAAIGGEIELSRSSASVGEAPITFFAPTGYANLVVADWLFSNLGLDHSYSFSGAGVATEITDSPELSSRIGGAFSQGGEITFTKEAANGGDTEDVGLLVLSFSAVEEETLDPVTSVQGKGGDVRLTVMEMDDVSFNKVVSDSGIAKLMYVGSQDNSPGTGNWSYNDTFGANQYYVNDTDVDGKDVSAIFPDTIAEAETAWLSYDGIAWTELTFASTPVAAGSGVRTLSFDSSTVLNPTNPSTGTILYLSKNEPSDNAEQDISLISKNLLQWDAVRGEFRPVLLSTLAYTGNYSDVVDTPVGVDGGTFGSG